VADGKDPDGFLGTEEEAAEKMAAEQERIALGLEEETGSAPNDFLKGTGGDQVFTVIEKIENSKVDIHSKIYGGLGVSSYAFPSEHLPGVQSSADGKSFTVTPSPATLKAELAAKAAPIAAPAPQPAAAEPEEALVPDPEEPEKEKEEAKEEPEPEKEEKAEETPPEEGAPEEEAFNPYGVEREDDVFAEEKKARPAAPPKPKPKPKEEPKPEEKAEEKKERIEINLRDDDYEKYGTHLKLTYLFDNMPNNLSYSKYKRALRNACRITLLGNLEEGLNLFGELKKQAQIPVEYKEMIDKNIRDVKYYLRGKYRSGEADLE